MEQDINKPEELNNTDELSPFGFLNPEDNVAQPLQQADDQGTGVEEQSRPPVPSTPESDTAETVGSAEASGAVETVIPAEVVSPIEETATAEGTGTVAEMDVTADAPSALPTDHESLLALGLENEKGRWLGTDEPPWVGEETRDYYLTNWSGYRNYHCKWPGCQFATVSGRPTVVIAMQDHVRAHRANHNAQQESVVTARREHFGLVNGRGEQQF